MNAVRCVLFVKLLQGKGMVGQLYSNYHSQHFQVTIFSVTLCFVAFFDIKVHISITRGRLCLGNTNYGKSIRHFYEIHVICITYA